MKRPFSCLTLLLALALLAPGCAYVKNRVMDMSDVIDIKYGYGIGGGAKIEVTSYVGLGVGYGIMPKTREWYGRRSHVAYHQEFVHFVVAGRDGSERDWGDPPLDGTDHYGTVLPLNLSALDVGYDVGHPPVLQHFRVGFEFLVPGLNFGMYLNFGEIVDLFAGIATFDPARDDGVFKSAQYPDNFVEELVEDAPES
jgi:hypothetical protein